MDPDNPVHIKEITSAEQFKTEWGAMRSVDGETVSIYSVFIHMHGEVDYIQGGDNKEIYVSDLEQKTIDTILMTSCDTGNMNYVGSNVA